MYEKLSHNPKFNGEYAVQPGDEIISFMDKIIDKIEHPLRTEDMLVRDIGTMYKKSSDRKERINLIFVTANGKVTERILGIITAWEIAAEVDRV